MGNAIHFGPLCLSQPRRVNYRKEWSVSVGRRRFYDCPSLVILSGTPPNQFWHPLFVFLPPFHPFSQSPFSPFMASFSYLFPYECAFGGLLNGQCRRNNSTFYLQFLGLKCRKSRYLVTLSMIHSLFYFDFRQAGTLADRPSSLCIPREKRSSA